jgi:hypothetical protein
MRPRDHDEGPLVRREPVPAPYPHEPADADRRDLAAVFAGIGYVLRYAFVEPEAIGNMCKSAAAAWWCPIRTGFIVTTEWNGLGYAATALAVVALVSAPRPAVPLAFVAMAIGGAGLILYNATEAGPGLILALLRLAWIESRRP